MVLDWIRSYSNLKTREDYSRALHLVLKKTGLTPRQLLDLELTEARHRVMGVVHDYIDVQRLGQARQIQSAVKSFLDSHDKVLIFKKSERIKKIRVKVNYEIIPSKDQIYAMADHIKKPGSLDRTRTRAIILCLFQSGVRSGCLCKWKVGVVKDQLYPEIKLPVRLKITNQTDTKISGYGLDYYYTFLQKEAAEALKEYLDWRTEKEGALDDGDPVFKPARKYAWNGHTSPERILLMVKAAAEAVGINRKSMWTHLICKSFRKVLNATEMDEDTREALMGHSPPGSRSSYFYLHDVDEIAKKYMRANFSPAFSSSDIKDELSKRDQQIQQQEELTGQLQKQIRDQMQEMEKLREEVENLRKQTFVWLKNQMPGASFISMRQSHGEGVEPGRSTEIEFSLPVKIKNKKDKKKLHEIIDRINKEESSTSEREAV